MAEQQKSFVGRLAAEYSQRLRRFLFTRVRNSADVPDLAQEVFLRMMRVEKHDVIRSPEAYLFTVASHVAHQHTLRESNAAETVDIAELTSDPQLTSPDDPVAYAELQERVKAMQSALDQLPAHLSTSLLLHRLAGFSIKEIGEQLGVARPTAKNYLAQALLHCRNARAGAEDVP